MGKGAAVPKAKAAPPAALLPTRTFYNRQEVATLQRAYRDIFPVITPRMRDYWDLDRQRDWCCLTSDFHQATFDDYQALTSRALEIERTIDEPVPKGVALRRAAKDLGVGYSVGVCPWTDHGLHLTYDANKAKNRITVMVMHDWYPIVPKRSRKPHPVDVPLWKYRGLHGTDKYVRRGAMPKAVYEAEELLLFLNFKPDYRPPDQYSTGQFSITLDCTDGFLAVIESIQVRFATVNLITFGAAAWHALRDKVNDLDRPETILAHARSKRGHGRALDLSVGAAAVKYLPLAHPCDTRNFDANHREHAHKGFIELGLRGAARLP